MSAPSGGGADVCDAELGDLAARLGCVVVDGRKVLGAARRDGLAAVNRGRREVVQRQGANEALRRAAGALAAEIERARLQRRRARFRAYLELAE